MLAAFGGALGIAIALAATPLVSRLVPHTMPIPEAPGADLRMLGLGGLVTILTGIAFGIVPAMRLTRGADSFALHEGGRSGPGRHTERLRSGLVIAFMLSRGMTLGTWLLAAFLLGHGLVHIAFATPVPATPAPATGMEYPFDINQSWLVTSRIADVSIVRILVWALVAVTVLGYLLAALSTVGIGVPTTLWPALVVVATAASAGLMVIGLTPALALGIAIDVALLTVVFTSAWSPAAPLPG